MAEFVSSSCSVLKSVSCVVSSVSIKAQRSANVNASPAQTLWLNVGGGGGGGESHPASDVALRRLRFHHTP